MRLIFFSLLVLLIPIQSLVAKETELLSSQKNPPLALLLDRVIDGDTFIAGGKRVRLWGIDAPEKSQPHFLAAKLYLETLLKEAPFSCFYKHKDRYQRLVMQCYSKEKDIAASLVLMGVAKDYPKYSKGAYAEDEAIARKNRYGIWSRSDVTH